MSDFNNTPLYNAIKGIRGTITHPKFILWLLNDETWGLLKVTKESRIIKDNINSILYLYEEWIKTGSRPVLLTAKNKEMRFGIRGLYQAVDIGAINYISRRVINVYHHNGFSKKELEEIQLQKINQLLSDNELFTEEDYENE